MDLCERPSCNHSQMEHPENGSCVKCGCIGFFRNLVIDNPVQEKYVQKVIDMKTQYHSILDMVEHLINDFPIMSKQFFDEKKKKDDKYWKNLYEENLPLWSEVNTVLTNFEKQGRRAVQGKSTEVLTIVSELMHHGANYQASQNFIQEMILSFIILMFRTFVKDISQVMFERDDKFKDEWKSLDLPQKEKWTRNLAEHDIRDMAGEIKKKFGLDLKSNSDFDDFLEPFYRRDMYVHNEGFPNQKYRNRVPYNAEDVKLVINSDYLLNTVKQLRKFSEIIEEYCLEKYMYVVNINKKGNVTHIDLTKSGGKIIPIKDD